MMKYDKMTKTELRLKVYELEEKIQSNRDLYHALPVVFNGETRRHEWSNDTDESEIIGWSSFLFLDGKMRLTKEDKEKKIQDMQWLEELRLKDHGEWEKVVMGMILDYDTKYGDLHLQGGVLRREMLARMKYAAASHRKRMG
jgi:hypothetical protein